MMKIIDPHLHLFDQQLGQFSWLAPDVATFWKDKALINKDFTITDIRLSTPSEACGFVHIEAGFDNQAPWRELSWLEGLATTNMKTIASVDLCQSSKDFANTLDKLCQFSSLCGVRHILDDSANALLQNSQVQHNLQQIAARELIFECQLNGTDTRAIDTLTKYLKHQLKFKIVINHAAFPAPSTAENLIWQNNMLKLAECDNVFVKASGWEMIDREYPTQHIQNIVTWLIGACGADKIMLASNFPLCLFSCSYQELWLNYSQLDFSTPTINALIYANAKNCYGF